MIRVTVKVDRPTFRKRLDDYRADRDKGDREHRRRADIVAGAISPQKLYGVPVGLMYFEGAPRLLAAGVSIPGMHVGDPCRTVVEGYPGYLARQLIGKRTYKQDQKRKQTLEHRQARQAIVEALCGGKVLQSHGVVLQMPQSIIDDPTGDELDAVLCLVQATWAWEQRHAGYGVPQDLDALEGWIADPGACAGY